MADTLLTFYPTPNDLVRAPIEALGRAVFVVAPGVMRQEMFNIDGLVASLYAPGSNAYPIGSQRQVRNAIAEALNWLERQGSIMRDPDQRASWYRLTRQGTAELVRVRELMAEQAAERRQQRPHPSLDVLGPTSPPTPLMATPGGPPPVRATLMAGIGEVRAEGTAEVTGQGISVQTFLVTTPLSFQGATLISLTLRFLDAPSDNELPYILAATLAEDFEGWAREPLASGAVLLDRLATIDGQVNPDLREAVFRALEEQAAALQFSDLRSFRASELVPLASGIVAFLGLPAADVLVGAVLAGSSLVLLQIAWGIGITGNYAVTQIGRAIVDRIAQKIRDGGRPR